MKNFDALVDIWQAQNTAPNANYEIILNHLKKTTTQFKLNISIGLVAMFFALTCIITLWFFIPFVYLTTHVSLAIFVLCCLYYIFIQFKNLKILANNTYTQTPKKHIEALQAFKLIRHKENTKNYFLYSLAIAVGLGLYFIEFFTKVSGIVVVASLLFTLFWFALSYFYFQRIFIKREEKIFANMFEGLNRIKNQFK